MRDKDTKASTSGRKGVAVAAAGVAATVIGLVAVRAVRRRSDDSGAVETIFHLKQDSDRWILEIEGSDETKASFETKEEGVAAARELAQGASPCELIIYRTDGTEQARHAYPA